MTVYNIRTSRDLEIIQNAILKNEDFIIGDVKPLEYKITLSGGRFEDYDVTYIDADIAKIILEHQKNYDKFLNELESKFNLKFSSVNRTLHFKLEKGSLEILGDIFSGLGAIKDMESKHKLYAIITVTSMWFASVAYNDYLQRDIKKINQESIVELQKLSNQDRLDEREQYEKLINKTLDTVKEISFNRKLQNAINNPKKQVVSILKEDEKAKIDDAHQELTTNNVEDFDYKEQYVEDIEETEIKDFIIDSYKFNDKNKPFKIRGVSALAYAVTLHPDKRISLIRKAENGEQVKLEVKYFKDGHSKYIKAIHILDFIEED